MSLSLIPTDRYSQVLNEALDKGLIDAEDDCFFCIDLDILDQRLDHLSHIFPSDTLHAIPVKTNPLIAVLEHVARRGHGAEAASVQELFIASSAGIPNEKLVWDSPVKTIREIKLVEKEFSGATVNANGLRELKKFSKNSTLRLGLRINPMRASGAPELYDVSGKKGKFGEPIAHRKEIIEAFLDYPNLAGLHLHAGSDIHDIAKNAALIESVYDLMTEIDLARGRKGLSTLEYFDLGGGASIPLDGSSPNDLQDYALAIQKTVPNLIEKQLITEFGRFTYAHCGWFCSRIEEVRSFEDGSSIIYIHAGADAFLREAYLKCAPEHKIELLDGDSLKIKVQEKKPTDIAGPLCFAGDYLSKAHLLPRAEENDLLIVTNAGANSYALWSRHCSRPFPKVLLYSQTENHIYIGKEKESMDDIIKFWGHQAGK